MCFEVKLWQQHKQTRWCLSLSCQPIKLKVDYLWKQAHTLRRQLWPKVSLLHSSFLFSSAGPNRTHKRMLHFWKNASAEIYMCLWQWPLQHCTAGNQLWEIGTTKIQSVREHLRIQLTLENTEKDLERFYFHKICSLTHISKSKIAHGVVESIFVLLYWWRCPLSFPFLQECYCGLCSTSRREVSLFCNWWAQVHRTYGEIH